MADRALKTPSRRRRDLPWALPAAFALAGFVKASLLVPMTGIGGGTLHEWAMNGALCLLAFAGLALLPPRLRRAAGWVLQLCLSLLLLTDLWYYRYYVDLPGFSVLQQVGQAPDVSRSIVDLMRPLDALVAVDLLAWPLLWWRGSPPAERAPWRRRVAAALALLLAGVMLGGGSLGRRMQRVPGGVMAGIWSQAWFARIHGPLFFHVWDAGRFAQVHLIGPGEQSAGQRAAVRVVRARADRLASLPAPLGGAARGANLIQVQVEALQAQVIGLKVGGQEITPNLNRLRSEGLYFERFYHQTAQGRTADAELAVLCGLLPAPHGVAFIAHPAFPQRCLPEILRDEAGYHTVAFHGHVGRFWNRRAVYPRIGLQRFIAKRELDIDEVIHMGLSDMSFLRQVAARLAVQPTPFFAHIITLSSHHPFVIPEAERRLKLGELRGTPIGDYLQAIHYADRALGAFFADLRARGLWETSLVVVYGDHDMGRLRDDAGVERLFGPLGEGPVRRFEWSRRVPWIVRLPGGRGARTVREATGMIDVGPTLLHLLGLRAKGRDLLGRDALAPGRRAVVFRDGTVTDGTLLYLRPGSGDLGGGRCHLLSSGALRPVEDCLPMARLGARELIASDTILVHGLGRDRDHAAP